MCVQSCPTLCDQWTAARQAPLSTELSRQEYWSGLPCPSPRDLPNPEMEPTSFTSPALASGLFTTTWEAQDKAAGNQKAITAVTSIGWTLVSQSRGACGPGWAGWLQVLGSLAPPVLIHCHPPSVSCFRPGSLGTRA